MCPALTKVTAALLLEQIKTNGLWGIRTEVVAIWTMFSKY